VSAPDDCLPLHPHAVRVQQSAGDWTIVDDNQKLLDFGGLQENAERAKAVMVHYGFDRICFVGRPYPQMMYFTVGG
jgi:hypothetical protein